MFKFSQRRWIYFAGVYFILILASSAVRWSRTEKPFPENKKSVEVFAVSNDKLLEKSSVRFAYQEFATTVATNKLPIILIHGSPGNSDVLWDLAKSLRRDGRRVIVPDLPGFGDSSKNIPDYSFRAHAFYLKQFAEKLNIEKFHLLGFSLGGGAALDFYDIAPEQVASIEMVSAVGVQEYELLGDYHLNHSLHGFQLALIWTLQNLTPHFGLLEDIFLDHSYARNFYDSDQRPLREILSRVEKPFLIVHGKGDPLVPLAAARESARLVPQSEYHELDDNHFMVFQRSESVAPLIADFLNRVETSAAKSKKNADAERIHAAAEPFKREMVMADGSTALVIFLVLALATFASEDLTLLTAGALAGQGQISLFLAVAACFVGIVGGDLLLFSAGRIFGRVALSRAPLRWFVSESALNRGAKWLEGNGLTAVFFSRFTPGLRLPLYTVAGTLRTNFFAFAFYFAFAAAVWTPILVGAAAWFSKGKIGAPTFTRSFWLGLFAVVGAGFILLNLILRLATWRGRRKLAGTYLRWTRWEFWSIKIFYPPVIVYIVWLAIKYRSISVFADANPAIEAGGFVGEPKQLIYESLQKSKAAKKHLLKYVFIAKTLEAAEKLNCAELFMRENALGFPVALKPNAGERGAGVFVIKNKEELQKRIADSDADLIFQEFAGGDEFGVFYYRFPNEKKGEIFAVTEKRFPVVTGDGKSDLETLILKDKRAVALADAYLERNRERLEMIPSAGEEVQIIDIGTHSKGAIFLDGDWAKTAALENEIDAICRGYKGFYFGRFDLRTESAEAFKKGEFKIIELNGVTSEATSIYDPKNSLFTAYRKLFAQWRIAFEIGRQNRKRGAKPTTVRQLAKLIYNSRFGTIPLKSEIRNSESEIECA